MPLTVASDLSFQFASATSRQTKTALLKEQAVDQFESFLYNYSSVDETLLRLNIERKDLSKLLDDDEITQTTDTRRDEVTSTPWQFEPVNHKQIEFYIEQLSPRMDQILESMWQSVLFGINVQEVIFEKPKGRVYEIKDIVEKPFHWFSVTRDRRLMYRNTSTGEYEPTMPVKFITTIRRGTYVNPMGDGILSRLYWPWFFRCNGWQYWMALLERFGLPFLIGTTREGKEPVTRKPYTDIMMEVLDKARQGSAIAVDEHSKVQALETVSGANNNNFKDFENAITGRIQKVVLGQTMSSDIKDRGSFAAARVGLKTVDLKRRTDIELLRRNFQLWLDEYHILNGFSGIAPKLLMQDPAELQIDRAERDTVLYAMGVRFTKEYVGPHYNLGDEEYEIVDQDAIAAAADAAKEDEANPAKDPEDVKKDDVEGDEAVADAEKAK